MSTLLVVAVVAVGACGSTEPARLSAAPEMSCAAWTAMSDRDRISQADRMVGDSADLLERIRVRQHQPVGTQRDTLILDVVGSVTKGCEIWATPEQPIHKIVESLY